MESIALKSKWLIKGAQSPPLLAIALLSAAALGYQVLLLRLFSIIQWHHFAYMIISLALLGYGASGTFLALLPPKMKRGFSGLFAVNTILFSFAAILCFLWAQHIQFNPLELFWTPGYQAIRLMGIYLILALPFFFAANALGLSFYHFHTQIGRVYSADLIGAGLGALGILVLLLWVFPLTALKIISTLALLAATLALLHCDPLPLWRRNDKDKGGWFAPLLLVFGLFGIVLTSNFSLQLSPYKNLSQHLQTIGATQLQERSSPLGLLTVVDHQQIPLRHAPGLSVQATAEIPKQLAIFTDGGGLTALNQYQPQAAAYLDFLPSAAPYQLLTQPQVLLLGAGGGSGVLQALYHQAKSIDAVELNSQLIELVQQDYAEFSGHLYEHQRVQVHSAEARSFIERHPKPYDLIQVALLDAFGASSAGLHALTEHYLYTVEGLQRLHQRLKPNGFLAITRWLKLPPRDSLKLWATAISALKAAGIHRPGHHLVLMRSWKTTTLLIKKTALTDAEIEQLRTFCQQRAFDLAYYPGMPPSEANQYHILEKPYFYQGTTALLANQEQFTADYKYHLAPARDDQPYFFHFFKWAVLPELLSLRHQGGLGLIEWGYPVLIVTLIQALLISMLFIIAPLWVSKSRISGLPKTRVLIYFFSLGLAFLFIEMAFIQKFILFLGHPLYAAATVLSAFLIFAGLGSRYATQFQRQTARFWGNPTGYATLGISILALGYLVLLPGLLAHFIALPLLFKMGLSLLLIAPLAFWMGMPFPLGLTQLGQEATAMIPWAWAINGCASVLSAIVATLLAVHFGFSWVILLAVMLYGLATLCYPQFDN